MMLKSQSSLMFKENTYIACSKDDMLFKVDVGLESYKASCWGKGGELRQEQETEGYCERLPYTPTCSRITIANFPILQSRTPSLHLDRPSIQNSSGLIRHTDSYIENTSKFEKCSHCGSRSDC